VVHSAGELDTVRQGVNREIDLQRPLPELPQKRLAADKDLDLIPL
jgi:hypothetical protein